MGGKRIDESVKRKVREAHGSGLSRKEIAKRFGISPTSVSRIVKETSAAKISEKPVEPTSAPEQEERDKKIEEIERRILDLEKRSLYWHYKKRG